MPGFDTASAVVSGVEGLAQIGFGIAEEKKADNELKRLKTPFYKIQDEYLKNLKLAESTAGEGLPEATKTFLTTESERGLGTGIKGILEAGGSPNDIAKLFDVFEGATMKTAATDAEARLGNIKNLMDVHRDLAGQKNIQFGVNELQPYQSALDSIQKRREAAIQNIFGGGQAVAGTLGAAGASSQNQKLLQLLAKQRTTNPNGAMFNMLFTPMADAYRSAFSGPGGGLNVSSGPSGGQSLDSGFDNTILTEDMFK